MKTMKATIAAIVVAAASLSFGGAVNAAPVGAAAKAVTTDQSTTNLQQVRHRKWHRHRHYNRRHWRHHRHGYYRGYRRPGFSLYIGPGYGYGYHRRHHRHHYWR